MLHRCVPHAVPAIICILAVSVIACDRGSRTLTGPSTTAPPPIVISSVTPAVGVIGEWLRIRGTGFVAGLTVTLDGITAPGPVIQDERSIFAATPPHQAGSVDIVVINPNGDRATLPGGFTYRTVTITASPSLVTTGSDLTVSWDAPPRQGSADWIGLFKTGDPNENYLWYEYTEGKFSGTLVIKAPGQPGQYEFRYLVDDSYNDAARTEPVTVVAAQPKRQFQP